jgi:hypothetical protein
VAAAEFEPVTLLAALFVSLWLAGLLVMATRLQRDVATARDLVRRGDREPPARIADLALRLRDELGVGRRVRVRLGETIPLPFSWGVLRPVVVLPLEAAGWTEAQLRSVLAHELSHVRRWDHLLLLLGELARVLYWLNPLVWLAIRRCGREREWSCDDAVLSRGVAGDQYALHLVAVARHQVRYAAALGMAEPGGLAHRIERVMNGALDRSRLGELGLAGLALAALLVLVPVATLGFGGADLRVPSTSELLDVLEKGENPRERRLAAWWLGEHESERAVRPLLRSLGDSSGEVRLVAAWALGEIKDDRAIDPLIELLDDPDPLVREMAVLSLGEIENPDAVDALADAAERSPELHGPMIWALGEIDTRRAHRLRGELCEAVGRRVRENQQVWAGDLPVLESGRGRRPTGDVPTFSDLDELMAGLRSEDSEVRHAAAFGIGWLGVSGDLEDIDPVEPLLDLLRDPDPGVRAMAVWSLDEINPSRWESMHRKSRRDRDGG